MSTEQSAEPGSPEDLWARLDSGDPASIVAFFKGMPEKERRAHTKTVKSHLTATNQRAFRVPETDRIDWTALVERERAATKTQAPAALATLGGTVADKAAATTVAQYLSRLHSRMGIHPECLDAVREVLADRAPSWFAELPDAAATAMGSGLRSGGYELVTVLAEVAGVVPVASAGFVQLWGLSYRNGLSMPEARAVFVQDPRLAELLPLMFDDDFNDPLFNDWTHFREAALAVVSQGLVPRSVILDANLRRLLRGGRGGAMQAHLKFWTALEATDAEIVEHISSCISMLSSDNGTAAKAFLASIQHVADAGLIDVELTLEAASIAVTRSEKNIVKTALGWLDALATSHPDRIAEIAGHLATAFGAQSSDQQERAVKLVGKRAKALDGAVRQRLVIEAEVYLAPDLVTTLAGLLGVNQDSSSQTIGYPELAAYAPRPLMPPIASPAELAEVVASVLLGGPSEAMVFERVLEAIVAFDRSDVAGLSAALKPVIEQNQPAWDWGLVHCPQTPLTSFFRLTEAAAGLGDVAREHPHRATMAQVWSRVRQGKANARRGASPADVLMLRMTEVRAALGLADLPPLVSIPTAASGTIDPAELAARLRTAESEGWVPLAVDFEQALLRLPEDCGDVDTSGFTSQAGLRFAAWVAGERLEVGTTENGYTQPRPSYISWGSAGRIDTVPASLFGVIPEVWHKPEEMWDQAEWEVCWPAIVPAYPDLVARALNKGRVGWYRGGRGTPEALLATAELDSPLHIGVHDLISTGLLHPEAPHRAAAVDAALTLAARGTLDPVRLATNMLAHLRGAATMHHLTPCLRDLANAGAAPQAWGTIAALLPGILPPAVDKSMAGTADLLGLATELADALAVRAPIAEVSAFAGKKGSSAVVSGARRLDAVLRAE